MKIMNLLFASVGIYLVISPIQADVEKDKRWKQYINNMRVALGDLKPCDKNNCTCLEPQIDRDLEPFTNGINKEDFEKAKELTGYGTHYQIINHHLYRQKECNSVGYDPSKCNGIEHFLNQIKENLPDMEFIINMMNLPQSSKHHANPVPVFSVSKDADHLDILFPAWSFWSGGPAVMPMYPTGLGRWDLHMKSITESAKKFDFESKKDQAFFRGSRTSKDRDPIILLSREEPDLVDASYTSGQAFKDLNDTLGAEPAKTMPFEDHCQYKYLFNFRGQAASFRFRHLFLCASTVFHVGNEYIEFFYSFLKPWVHYVPVEADFSNAKDLLEFYREHPDYAVEIALRGRFRVVDHLKMEDVRCYWEKLLKKYASLTKWKPELDESFIEIGGVILYGEL